MPELAEVEIARRQMEAWWRGRPVDRIEIHDPCLVVCGQVAGLVGATVREVWRRGKYLGVDTCRGVLVLHLRMTGKVIPRDGRKSRMTLRCGGTEYDFVDTRRLGCVWAVSEEDLSVPEMVGGLATLGPEPWPDAMAGAVLRARLGKTRRAIKVALLDQKVIAGVGNIVAAEALWMSRVHPWRPAEDLSLEELDAIGRAICGVCDDVIAREGGAEVEYLHDRTASRAADNRFLVYGQLRCPECGGAIARARQVGRATWWCPVCQSS
jgi:formamidopyrimidine-DNA glycosylase